MKTTLRKLDEQLAEAYWSTWDSADNHASYGFLADLVRDLDEREDYDEADREYRLVDRGNGEYLLLPAEFGGTEPKYIVLTPEAFRAKFRLNEYGQTLEEAFNAYLETYNGFEPWSDEERADWLAQCEREGFDLEQAARLYDEERAEVSR